MRRRLIFLLAFAASLAVDSPATAQPSARLGLCFLSAGLGIGWPARIYCVDRAGGYHLVNAVSDDAGVVLADYDRHVLVVGSNVRRTVNGVESDGIHVYSVIDMSSPVSRPHQVAFDYDSSERFISRTSLLDVPGRGLMLAVESGDNPTKDGRRPADALTAFRLSPEAESAAEVLPFSALTYVRTSGFIGGGAGDDYSLPIPHLRGDPLGVLVADGRPHQTAISRPPYLEAERDELFDLDANNDAIAAITDQRPRANARNVVDIFDKKAGTWYRATAPYPIYRVRAFGPWVAGIAVDGADGGRPAHIRISPGKEDRKAIQLNSRMTLADLFDGEGEPREYYPGDLFIVNGLTRRQFTIHTGQGDSEVVLVTDDAVYYRVNDALFQANFADGKLTAGMQIARGAEVALCHWAFLSAAPAETTRGGGRR